jgi:hypothetical protein
MARGHYPWNGGKGLAKPDPEAEELRITVLTAERLEIQALL